LEQEEISQKSDFVPDLEEDSKQEEVMAGGQPEL